MSKTISIDELTGLETIHHYDHTTGYTHIEHRQDVSAVIERNKEFHKTSYQHDGVKNNWVHAASIPEVIQIQWMREYGIKDIYSTEYWPLIKRLLNSPEYRYLKTGTMKL